jgi:hypothetical protein
MVRPPSARRGWTRGACDRDRRDRSEGRAIVSGGGTARPTARVRGGRPERPAATPAAACRASTARACRGRRGSHLIAKNAMTGICPAMSSCQRCAAVPSSASRATPTVAMWLMTKARAASDIAGGIKCARSLESRVFLIGGATIQTCLHAGLIPFQLKAIVPVTVAEYVTHWPKTEAR